MEPIDLSALPDDASSDRVDANDINRAKQEEQALINALGKSKNWRYWLNTSLRVGLSVWGAIIVFWWLSKVHTILTKNNTDYCLSDGVLIALITTTTLNVLVIMHICFKDIFDGKSEDKIK